MGLGQGSEKRKYEGHSGGKPGLMATGDALRVRVEHTHTGGWEPGALMYQFVILCTQNERSVGPEEALRQ